MKDDLLMVVWLSSAIAIGSVIAHYLIMVIG